MALNMAVLCCYAMLEYSHCRCPTSHVPHTTDTVPSSATFKALSEAGMHVLCDTLHVTSLYIRCTSVCVCGLTDFVTSDSCQYCSDYATDSSDDDWREVQRRKIVKGL